jgi:hypothetical protein
MCGSQHGCGEECVVGGAVVECQWCVSACMHDDSCARAGRVADVPCWTVKHRCD